MPELREPVPVPLEDQLRTAVVEHRRSEVRREHPVGVHAGPPGGPRARFVAPWPGPPGRAGGAEPLDHAARCDVVGRLLDALPATPVPLLWLTRPASHEDPDEDRAWLAAALGAAAERGVDPHWVIVTTEGWHDPRSGVLRRP